MSGSGGLRGAVSALLAVALLLGSARPAAAQDGDGDRTCIQRGNRLICQDHTGGGGGGPGGTVPEDAIWFVYYNPAAECYATGWERPGGTLGYAGWAVLTEATFPVLMALFTWLGTGTFTWEDFDADGDGAWDGGEAAAAANALFASFDVDACAGPPTDNAWVLAFIASLDFTAGAVATAPPGDPVVGLPAYVTLEPDYTVLEASGGVVVQDPDGSTSVVWDLTNPSSGNTISVTADPVYRVYWDLVGDPDLFTESHRGDLTWPAEGQGELTHVYEVDGPRELLGQVRWQVRWETPVASGTEEFVRETPHAWTVRQYQAVVDGR